MAIVITNGTYYICLNENGKHRKTEDINKAIQYLKDKNVGVEMILDGRTA